MFKIQLVVCLLFLAPNAFSQTVEVAPARRTMTAGRLEPDERIALDGRMEEPIWSRLAPATDFIQFQPDNGAPASQRTEVRIAFSHDALYMGVTCFDTEPDKMLGNTMKRDEFLRSDDRFQWVIDPFNNGQGGYFFEMNPSGLMADAQMSSSAQINREWDAIWDAHVLRSEIGWTIEIMIPFRTLNFDPKITGWGINFQRTIRGINEDSVWMGWGLNEG